MVGYRTISLALLMCALLPGVAQANSTTDIIVKRDPGLTAAERADIRADADVRLVETLSLPRTEVVAAEPGDVADALRDLNADPDVVYAERDSEVRVFTADTYFHVLWAFENTGQEIYEDGPTGTPDADSDIVEAWTYSDGTDLISGVGQVVGVVDSGIDADHEDLDENVIDATTYVEDGQDETDRNGHGTHVAGTIAAERDNGEGVVGVAPSAKIRSYRAMRADGAGKMSDVAEAFLQAGVDGVRIVNASLGGDDESQAVREAIALYPNTLFVVAAGNDHRDNDDEPTYPCNTAEPNVLCVGNSTYEDERASGSSFGKRAVDTFAPGTEIYSTIPRSFDPTDPYAYFGGTSMSAPLVSGIAALLLQADNTFTAVELKNLIMASGDDITALNDFSISGRRANAEKAVKIALGLEPAPVDTDTDGWVDEADACPAAKWDNTADGCEPDDDWDQLADSADNCPDAYNPTQKNSDSDPAGDACDPDMDNDGVLNGNDFCQTTPGPASHRGCQPPTSTTPPSTGTGPDDADGDGVVVPTDACPNERAATGNGCPLAQVSSLSAKGGKRSATVKVVATRADSQVKVTVERKKGRRWVRVTRKTVFGTSATLKFKRLKRGTHRVRISISSSAGRGDSVTKTFRVR